MHPAHEQQIITGIQQIERHLNRIANFMAADEQRKREQEKNIHLHTPQIDWNNEVICSCEQWKSGPSESPDGAILAYAQHLKDVIVTEEEGSATLAP